MLAEIRVDMTRFPDAGHLVFWGLFPRNDCNTRVRKRHLAQDRAGDGDLGCRTREPPSSCRIRSTCRLTAEGSQHMHIRNGRIRKCYSTAVEMQI
ncbi:hypothetical protein [Cupriavidus necator]|uniref:hypothetical protein n=1 Tax=Cupriavidus necator TaxID=106590 RepID=UPI001F3875D7|nr:hypothetical protein [Cupriavidus necator]